MAVPEKFVNIGIVGFTDKGEYAPENIYMMNDIVHRDNGLWRCLVDNTTGIEPEENHNWTVFIQSSKELGGITATDSKGIMGPEGEMVSAQELMEKLSAPEFEDFSQEGAAVPDARTAVSKILSGVPIPKIFSKMKAALMGLVTLGEMRAFLVNNGLCTEEGKYFLDAAYGKTLKDAIDSTNSNLGAMTFHCERTSGNFGTLILNSEKEDPSSCEGSQITMYGKGGNAGTIFNIDCFDNVLRIFYTINEQLIVYNFKPDGIYINNERINSFTQAIYSGDIYQLAPGAYYCTPSVLNLPKDNIYFFVEIFNWENGKEKIIRATSTNEPNARHVYTNFFSGGNWQGWLMLA